MNALKCEGVNHDFKKIDASENFDTGAKNSVVILVVIICYTLVILFCI